MGKFKLRRENVGKSERRGSGYGKLEIYERRREKRVSLIFEVQRRRLEKKKKKKKS